jgi:hypothetical protein
MRMRIISCTYGMAAASLIGKEIDAAGTGLPTHAGGRPGGGIALAPAGRYCVRATAAQQVRIDARGDDLDRRNDPPLKGGGHGGNLPVVGAAALPRKCRPPLMAALELFELGPARHPDRAAVARASTAALILAVNPSSPMTLTLPPYLRIIGGCPGIPNSAEVPGTERLQSHRWG